MIDFTNLPTRNKSYNGANGAKKSVVYNDQLYMLKLPNKAKINPALSYANAAVSEHIASTIFNIIGVNAQETILGKYTYNNIERTVVACKDFTMPNYDFYDFASLRNQVVDSESLGHSTELSDILDIFEQQMIIPEDEIKEFFWNTFIVDALLGNWDRHNGNWGYLHDRKTDEVKIAPVFDNGSSLFPQADEKIMKSVLNNAIELNKRIYEYPKSAITINNNKINYFDFITSKTNNDCNNALKRICPKINLKEINDFIDSVEGIKDIQKEFYKTMIKKRKESILDFALSK